MAAALEAYITSFPSPTQTILRNILAITLQAAPGSQAGISYGVAAIKRNGTYIIYCGGYAKHISIYPVYSNDPALGEAIAAFASGKATVKLSLTQPIPYDLIQRIVEEKVKECDLRAAAKVEKSAKKVVKVVKSTKTKAVKATTSKTHGKGVKTAAKKR